MNEEMKSEVHVRFDILNMIYSLNQGNQEQHQKIFPAQVDNCSYSDMNYHLRLMQNKGYLEFQPHMMMRTFEIKLTGKGISIVEQFHQAFFSKDENRDYEMTAALEHLK